VVTEVFEGQTEEALAGACQSNSLLGLRRLKGAEQRGVTEETELSFGRDLPTVETDDLADVITI